MGLNRYVGMNWSTITNMLQLPAVIWYTSDSKSLFVVIACSISWISIDQNIH